MLAGMSRAAASMATATATFFASGGKVFLVSNHLLSRGDEVVVNQSATLGVLVIGLVRLTKLRGPETWLDD